MTSWNLGYPANLASFGCTREEQMVYKAEFQNIPAGQTAADLCKQSHQFKATVPPDGGQSMTPTACGTSALFAVDDSTCKASISERPPPPGTASPYCVYCGTPPGYTTKVTRYALEDREDELCDCGNCRVVAGECKSPLCPDGVEDFGEECDTGGKTDRCTIDCRYTGPGRDEPPQLAGSSRKSALLAARSGFVFASRTIVGRPVARRDIWWDGRQLLPVDAAYSLGVLDSLDGPLTPEPARFRARAIRPRVGEVIVLRMRAARGRRPVYVAIRISALGGPSRKVVFYWTDQLKTP
jgi:hypothetical protein